MQMQIDHETGDRFAVTIRGHRLVVDQPVAEGGEDSGPTPTELFAASLGACVAFYANRALRDAASGDGLPRVALRFAMSSTPPARVAEIAISVEVPAGISDARLTAVRRAVAHCTVHNTLMDPPQVAVTVTPAPARAADPVGRNGAAGGDEPARPSCVEGR